MSVPSSSEYLNQLLQDKTTIAKMPKTVFVHMERLLDDEINRVRNELYPTDGIEKELFPVECNNHIELKLPPPRGQVVKLTEKVYAPVKEYPKFNFVGRIIGPRGMTLRQVEASTGGKLLVRGRGSMKDKKLEEEKRGQPNYEHLDEDLHVLITVEDTDERAHVRMEKAKDEVKRLITPVEGKEDELKKKQLRDLAALNGTIRETPVVITGSNPAAFQAGILGTPLPHGIPAGLPIHPGRHGMGARVYWSPEGSQWSLDNEGIEYQFPGARQSTILDFPHLEPSILGKRGSKGKSPGANKKYFIWP